MKKFLSAILFLAAMTATVFCLTACGDDELDEATDGGGNIVGTWSFDWDEFVADLDELGIFEELIQFQKNGKYVHVSYAKHFDDPDSENLEIEHGTYTIDGDMIYITIEDREENVGRYKVSGNTLTLTPLKGVVIGTTWTKVKDSAINKYLRK